jgi:hypothetical protein
MTRLGIAAGANPLTFAGLGGDRRRHRHVRLDPLAQPPPRRRAGERPQVGPTSSASCPERRRAPTRSTRRSGWRAATTSSCRSRRRSTTPCSRARASSAAWSICCRANRRTSWRISRPGPSGSGVAAGT